jgi:parvulin-like peptidyl-prolyl isomerase
VLSLIQPALMRLEGKLSDDEMKARLLEAYKEGLDALVERALIIEEFGAAGGELPDRLIEDQITNFINDRFKNDRAAFLQALVEERMTLDDWREETRNRLIVQIMRRREVADRVVISPSEVRAMYEARAADFNIPEQVKLRMIVLQRGKTDDERAASRKKADDIHAKLADGADFAQLATEASQGPNAKDGGDRGWMSPGDLRDELAVVARTLKSGEVSGVVETDEALYILKVEDHKDASLLPFAEARPKIEDEIREREELRLYKALIERLKRKFYVQVFKAEDALQALR